MMAQSWVESTWEMTNYGRFIHQFPPNIIRSIRQFERINKKYVDKKCLLCSIIYIYIYIPMAVWKNLDDTICTLKTYTNRYLGKRIQLKRKDEKHWYCLNIINYIYIYIYIERERERERESKCYIYIYIYIEIESVRESEREREREIMLYIYSYCVTRI